MATSVFSREHTSFGSVSQETLPETGFVETVATHRVHGVVYRNRVADIPEIWGSIPFQRVLDESRRTAFEALAQATHPIIDVLGNAPEAQGG